MWRLALVGILVNNPGPLGYPDWWERVLRGVVVAWDDDTEDQLCNSPRTPAEVIEEVRLFASGLRDKYLNRSQDNRWATRLKSHETHRSGS